MIEIIESVSTNNPNAYIASELGEDSVILLRLDGTFSAEELRQLAKYLDEENV